MVETLSDRSVVGCKGAGGNCVTRNAIRNPVAAAFIPWIFRFDFGDGRGARSIEHPAFKCVCGAMLPAPMEPGYQVCNCPHCHTQHPFAA